MVYFDTEFTRFRDEKHEPMLISIGCVAQDGHEFYRETNDTYQLSDCSDFVIENVMPLLDPIGSPSRVCESRLAKNLKDWVESLDGAVTFSCDFYQDWDFVYALFQFYGWPKNMSGKCHYLVFTGSQQQKFERNLAKFWEQNVERRHHALIDARALQHAAKQAIRRGL